MVDKRKTKRRGGFYWLGENEDKPYVSVTTVVDIIAKPALMYWFGGQVYKAMVVDPTLSKKEAFSNAFALNKKSKDRGTAVHSIVEAWKNIDEVKGKDSQYRGYAEAFEKWLEDNDVKVIENEKTVQSEKYKYAGTLDMLAEINGDLTVIDFKTGKDLYPEVHLQLSAYKRACEESGHDVEETMAVLLNEDGTYKQEIGKDKFGGFLAAMKLWAEYNDELVEDMRWK